MKIVSNRRKLLEACQVAGSVVASSTTKPILQDLKLIAHDTDVDVFGTDLEVGIRATVSENEVLEEGGIVLSASRLVDILRELADETVILTVKDQNCEIEGVGSEFSIVGDSPEQFPVLSDFPEGDAIALEGKLLLDMSRKTVFAVATEEGRYAINGVLMTIEGRTIEMVGTDGRRLARAKGQVENPTNYNGGAIVPAKAISELERLITADDRVLLRFEETQVLVAGEKGHLCAQLVEGQFPKYTDVIPVDLDKKVSLSPKELEIVVRRASLLSDPQSRSVRFELKSGKLTATSQSPGAGSARVEMALQYDGEPVQISFNPDFLLQMLKTIDVETIQFEFKDRERPGLFHAGADYLYLVMPVSLE